MKTKRKDLKMSRFAKLGQKKLRSRFKTEAEYKAHMREVVNARWKDKQKTQKTK